MIPNFVINAFDAQISENTPLPHILQEKQLKGYIDLDLAYINKYFTEVELSNLIIDSDKLQKLLFVVQEYAAHAAVLKFHDMRSIVLKARILVEREALKTTQSLDDKDNTWWVINLCTMILNYRKATRKEK